MGKLANARMRDKVNWCTAQAQVEKSLVVGKTGFVLSLAHTEHKRKPFLYLLQEILFCCSLRKIVVLQF